MNLRHFKIFKVLCENKNMTKTAQLLHMTQPAVSQVVRELEAYYNTTLFERLNRRLYLTQSGEKLQGHVLGLLSSYDQLEEDMLYHLKPKLKIGATVTIGTYGLGMWMKTFKMKYPDVELEVYIMNTQDLKQALLKSELDIGLSEGYIHHPDLMIEPFYKDKLVVIAPRNTFVDKQMDLSILAKNKFFIREEGSGSRQLALEAFKAQRLSIQVVGSFTNNEAIIKAVESELGFGIVSQLALKNHEVQMIENLDLQLERNFNLVYHKDKKRTAHLIHFMEVFQKVEDNKIESRTESH